MIRAVEMIYIYYTRARMCNVQCVSGKVVLARQRVFYARTYMSGSQIAVVNALCTYYIRNLSTNSDVSMISLSDGRQKWAFLTSDKSRTNN